MADGERERSELSATILVHANYLRASAHLAGFSPAPAAAGGNAEDRTEPSGAAGDDA
jgi:hypothetical protein